jgi:hypothetical protein
MSENLDALEQTMHARHESRPDGPSRPRVGQRPTKRLDAVIRGIDLAFAGAMALVFAAVVLGFVLGMLILVGLALAWLISVDAVTGWVVTTATAAVLLRVVLALIRRAIRTSRGGAR